MTKHPYQTCLRMPLTLKEDMTTICDLWRDVRGLIVVGRTMPRPIDVEQVASVLTGSATQDVGTEDHWYLDQGFKLTYWQQTEAGGWEKKT